MSNEESFKNLMRAMDMLIAAYELTNAVDAQVSKEVWQAKNVLEGSAARYAFSIKRNEWNSGEA